MLVVLPQNGGAVDACPALDAPPLAGDAQVLSRLHRRHLVVALLRAAPAQGHLPVASSPLGAAASRIASVVVGRQRRRSLRWLGQPHGVGLCVVGAGVGAVWQCLSHQLRELRHGSRR